MQLLAFLGIKSASSSKPVKLGVCILSGIAGPLLLWSAAEAFTGSWFSRCKGWSDALDSGLPLATLSKTLLSVSSSDGW